MKLSFDEEHRHAMNELGESDTNNWLLTQFWLISDWMAVDVLAHSVGYLSLQVGCRRWRSYCRWIVRCSVWAVIITASLCGDTLAWHSPISPLVTWPIRSGQTKPIFTYQSFLFSEMLRHRYKQFLALLHYVSGSGINQITSLLFISHQATLCSMKGCMRAMVAQLKSESEDLQQVSSHLLLISMPEMIRKTFIIMIIVLQQGSLKYNRSFSNNFNVKHKMSVLTTGTFTLGSSIVIIWCRLSDQIIIIILL